MAIIIKTVGGLGNQLFQYAFARAVSRRMNTTFLLDIAAFDPKLEYWPPGTLIPEYYLHHFNAKIDFAIGSNMLGFVFLRRQYTLFNKIYSHLRLRRFLLPFYFPEKTFAFDPEVFMKNGPVYFDGFWQTEKYFKDIAEEIRKEVTLARPFETYSQEVSDKIKETHAVSLHVRRTVFVSDPAISAFHGSCSLKYYKSAVEHIIKSDPSPHFFLFSDDHEWVEENFKWLPFPYTCVKNGIDKNYEDMILMSQCRHHIIANSSFSWWGAWLNPRSDKIVIAPKKWFANAPKNDTRDLLPDNWIKL